MQTQILSRNQDKAKMLLKGYPIIFNMFKKKIVFFSIVVLKGVQATEDLWHGVSWQLPTR